MQSLILSFKKLNPWRAMAIYMICLALYGIYALGNPVATIKILAVAVPVGLVLDYALHKIGGSRPKFGAFPQSGLISALIVSVLMPAGISLLVVAVAAALAVASKHYLRFDDEHIFNPAAFGVTITALVFKHPLGWWPDSYIWLAIVFGLVNIWRVKKYWQVLSFAVIYLLALSVLFGSNFPALAALPWFFMLFMLPEPVTSSPGLKQEIVFGSVVAAGAIASLYFKPLGPVALTLGLLAANASRYGWRLSPVK